MRSLVANIEDITSKNSSLGENAIFIRIDITDISTDLKARINKAVQNEYRERIESWNDIEVDIYSIVLNIIELKDYSFRAEIRVSYKDDIQRIGGTLAIPIYSNGRESEIRQLAVKAIAKGLL